MSKTTSTFFGVDTIFGRFNALNFFHIVNVDGDSHKSQSFLELEIGSELPNCCKCFELSPGDRVKKALGPLALSLILSNPKTPALP